MADAQDSKSCDSNIMRVRVSPWALKRPMFTYIAWLTAFVWIPTLALWAKNFETLRRYRKTLIYCVLASLLIAIPWDYWATKAGAWEFPPNTNLGIWFGGIPLEEYLFITFVTLEVSVLTLVLKNKFKGPGN